MPYESIKELPDSVRDNLPKHAQEVYVAADAGDWKGGASREEVSHKVAWTAVKKKDEKKSTN